ncbi:putative leader peptide [Streptomyces sp. NPDC002962]
MDMKSLCRVLTRRRHVDLARTSGALCQHGL